MIRIVQLSDLHISRRPAKNHWVRTVVGEIQTRYFAAGAPETYVLVTGDITDDGHPDQYRQAYEILKGLKGRLLLCPGNHDYAIEGTFLQVEGAAQQFDEILCAALECPGKFRDRRPVVSTYGAGGDRVRLIGLNSVLVQGPPASLALGMIGHDQLSSLNALLSETGAPPTIVYLHHRPEKPESVDGKVGRRLLDMDQFLDVVRDRARVIAFGHDGGPDASFLGQLFPPTSRGPIHSNANHCLSGGGACVLMCVVDGKIDARYTDLQV